MRRQQLDAGAHVLAIEQHQIHHRGIGDEVHAVHGGAGGTGGDDVGLAVHGDFLPAASVGFQAAADGEGAGLRHGHALMAALILSTNSWPTRAFM